MPMTPEQKAAIERRIKRIQGEVTRSEEPVKIPGVQALKRRFEQGVQEYVVDPLVQRGYENAGPAAGAAIMAPVDLLVPENVTDVLPIGAAAGRLKKVSGKKADLTMPDIPKNAYGPKYSDDEIRKVLAPWVENDYPFIAGFQENPARHAKATVGEGYPIKYQVDDMAEVITSLQPYNGEIYRLQKHSIPIDKIKVGDKVSSQSWTSFSKRLDRYLIDTPESSTGTQTWYRVKNNKHGRDISEFSDRDEYEVLVPKGVSYRVTGKTYDKAKDMHIVDLEEIETKAAKSK